MPKRSRIRRSFGPPSSHHERSKSRTARVRSSNSGARSRGWAPTEGRVPGAADAASTRRRAEGSGRERPDLPHRHREGGEIAGLLERDPAHEPAQPGHRLLPPCQERGESLLDGRPHVITLPEDLLGYLPAGQPEVLLESLERPAM